MKPALDLKPLTSKLGIIATVSLMTVLLHALVGACANLLLYLGLLMRTRHKDRGTATSTAPHPACLGATGIRDAPK